VAMRVNCETCGSVDDGLQSVEVAAWQTGMCDVTVVKLRHAMKLEISVDNVERGSDRRM